jgi:hypothetical protein
LRAQKWGKPDGGDGTLTQVQQEVQQFVVLAANIAMNQLVAKIYADL